LRRAGEMRGRVAEKSTSGAGRSPMRVHGSLADKA
jgi:hypothetical protein